MAYRKYRTLRITFNGKTQNLAQWSRELGFARGVLYGRLYAQGWDVQRALSEPPRPRAPNGQRAQSPRSILLPETRARMVRSQAALTEHMQRKMREFIQSVIEGLRLQAEVAAEQMAVTHDRGGSKSLQTIISTGCPPQRERLAK